MPRKQHTHKYIKRETGSSPVWACALEDCNHFMPSHLSALVVGRSSFCWQCDDKFILDSNAVSEDRPRCINCRTGHKLADVDKLIESLTEIK